MNLRAVPSTILCDTGILSRAISRNAPFLEAYEEVVATSQPVISTAVYIELQHWLVLQRGLVKEPISRPDYERFRKSLDTYLILNSDSVSEQAIHIARRWPDTGVGDCYTIATALVFDVPVFTLNPKHFERVPGIVLYKPDNYTQLLLSVRRKA